MAVGCHDGVERRDARSQMRTMLAQRLAFRFRADTGLPEIKTEEVSDKVKRFERLHQQS
jgi:hypothetical protein